MRLTIAVLLTFFSLLAHADTREQVIARGINDDLDFNLTLGEPKSKLVPVTISVFLDELTFVTEGDEQVARVAMLRVKDGRIEQVLDENIRVAAPRNSVPRGDVRRKFELEISDRATLVVYDVNSQRAGTRVIVRDGKAARIEPMDDARDADATWRDARERATRERKPILVLFRTRACSRCRELSRTSIHHPSTLRRLPAVVFATLPANVGEASTLWSSTDPGMALFDRSGVMRIRWPIVPDTMDFNLLLEVAATVAPNLEKVVQFEEAQSSREANLELATMFTKLGRTSAAKAALARAGVTEAPPQTPEKKTDESPIRILALAQQLVSGRHTVRTRVSTVAVASVKFSLDGRDVARITRAPFTAKLDFGNVPERHTIAVIAYDKKNRVIGRDERIVNEGGETFWVRINSPREGHVSGNVRIAMSARVPIAHHVSNIVLSWNDAERATLTREPFEAALEIPESQLGILRAVAELDDGRTTEDAVLLNAGVVGNANVQLIELPITRTSTMPLKPENVRVREGKRTRKVESIATAAETPLTVGILIDVSASMQKTLPDVQEAAIRFVETALTPRDRAFIVTFDSVARLHQPPTSDVALLREKIMNTRPNGLTALNDALAIALLQFEGIKGRRGMIVFSDGIDRTSRYSAADVRELARRANVPIHVIAAKAWSPVDVPGTPGNIAGLWIDDPPNEELRGIALSVGGTFDSLASLDELPAVYARVEAALRAQVLAFISTEPATHENDWRAIDVEVTDEKIHAPAGYYAVW